jgi:hypothetical protein
MAAARHNLSRRAVLGAGVGACVAWGGAAASTSGGTARSLPFGPGPGPGSSGPFPSAAGKDALRQARGKPEAAEVAGRRVWDRALARFRRAEAALAAWRAEEATLPPARRAWPHSQALDDRFGRLDDVRLAALRRRLRAPAPDLAALSLKIDLVVGDQAWELSGADRFLAALKTDARKLCRGG